MLMTDGVYKSIESTFAEKAGIDSNKVLMSMMNHEKDQLATRKRKFEILADRVLGRTRANHEDAYKRAAAQDVRSPIAIECRKRDDMTLLIHQFERGLVSFV
jgi:TAK1-binding protein 1